MCTAISFKTKDHYFGRNLDLEFSYSEEVTITPRNFPFCFRKAKKISKHYAIIGMAIVVDNYPLYYDATNENGLSAAGLNFPGNAVYGTIVQIRDNVAPFELIPWILSQSKNVDEAKILLSKISIINEPYNSELPVTPLHWIIADKEQSVIVEATEAGLRVYSDPYGMLTNNPPFPFHLENIKNYLNVTASEASNRFAPQKNIIPYSRGMGGIGLPGDLSSASRYIRAAFTKLNSVCDLSENESVNQFFHILDSVAQTKGCAQVRNSWEITQYSSCCNTDKGIYYYKTYNNSQLTAVSIRKENLNSESLIRYPLRTDANIFYEN